MLRELGVRTRRQTLHTSSEPLPSWCTTPAPVIPEPVPLHCLHLLASPTSGHTGALCYRAGRGRGRGSGMRGPWGTVREG